jgi:hypothetical protein
MRCHTRTISGQFLKFTEGNWITNTNEILPIGKKMIVNMEQLRGEDNPRDPDQYTYYLMMKDPDYAEDKCDGVYTFVTSSNGGRGAIRDLRKAYERKVRERRPDCPIIVLEVGSYMHRDRSFGRVNASSRSDCGLRLG